MQSEIEILVITAITISFLHTVSGPDHYLPFIALAKSRGWSVGKTIWWTVICGCGHVWSSVLLGLGGAAIGWSLSSISWAESIRGGLAGWCLVGFGLIYFCWGLIRARQNKLHKHFDVNDTGVYVFEHHHGEVVPASERHAVTPWVMFIVFVLGPCEPMIPLLYFPAAKASWWAMCILIIIYTLFTLATMIVMVLMGYHGLAFLKVERLQKYMHALGGVTILICGAGIVFLNW